MKTLIVLLGPTGVGKTALSLKLAECIGSPIISADSRQIYKDLVIGTAAPTHEEQERIKHYMVGTLELSDYYSASRFEEDTLNLLQTLFTNHEAILMTGGSMMYIDALCKGIDDIPTVTPAIRKTVWEDYEKNGLSALLDELQRADPIHYNEVDRQNYRRVIHAIEICRMTGKPYSSFRTHATKERPFRILKIGLTRPREELFERINQRVDEMIQNGLIDEAQKVYPMRELNALNTVGYKELFAYFDGKFTLDEAIEKMKRNTRVYARKQMTWFKRDADITWFHPDDQSEIWKFLAAKGIGI